MKQARLGGGVFTTTLSIRSRNEAPVDSLGVLKRVNAYQSEGEDFYRELFQFDWLLGVKMGTKEASTPNGKYTTKCLKDVFSVVSIERPSTGLHRLLLHPLI